MPKIVTRHSRIAEASSAAAFLEQAIQTALDAESNGGNLEDAWRAVADASGQIQRRARQLAGLGRGG